MSSETSRMRTDVSQTSRALAAAASGLRSAVNKVQALSAISQCRSVIAGALRQVKASGGQLVPGFGDRSQRHRGRAGACGAIDPDQGMRGWRSALLRYMVAACAGERRHLPAGSIDQEGNAVKLLAIAVAMLALSQAAIAQTPACKSVVDPAARLACYDKAAPPATSTAKPASAKGPASKAEPAKYVDTIGAEDALMNARLKNICRGC